MSHQPWTVILKKVLCSTLHFFPVVVALVATLSVSSCTHDETIKIGVVVPLTGRGANFGATARDGAILAVNEVNDHGGINGKMFELIIRDNKLDPEECKQAISDLIAADVVGIIGPVTSSMALETVPLINYHKIPTIGPTVSTDQLSGKDDFFFRTIPVTSGAAKKTAEYVVNKKKYRSVQVVYDTRNRAYTEYWYTAFEKRFNELNGGSIIKRAYSSEPLYDFLSFAKEISREKMDCLIVLANGMDTALISQQLSKLAVKIPLIACEWSATKDLLEYGGKTVEGLELFHSFNLNDSSQSFLQFSESFQMTFGYSPSFSSAYAYNGTRILLSALGSSRNGEKIKEFFLKNGPFQGVQQQISFDEFGDITRDYSLLRVENNKIVTVSTDATN